MSPIYVSAGDSYELHPEGLYPAVCCDVVDLGMVESQWGTRHEIALRWQTDQSKTDGSPFVMQRRFTASLHEKANLRHSLESWRGKRFSEEETKKFDLEVLLGVQAQIQIVHATSARGGTFANVNNVLPTAKGQGRLTVRDYVREVHKADIDPGAELEDDNEPF